MNLTGKVVNKQEAVNLADNSVTYHVSVAILLNDVWVGTINLPIADGTEYNSYTLNQAAALTLTME